MVFKPLECYTKIHNFN